MTLWIEQYSIHTKSLHCAALDGTRYDDLLRCVAAHFNVKSDKVRTVSSAILSYTYLYTPTNLHCHTFDHFWHIANADMCFCYRARARASDCSAFLFILFTQTDIDSVCIVAVVVSFGLVMQSWIICGPGYLWRESVYITLTNTRTSGEIFAKQVQRLFVSDFVWTLCTHICNINANTINTQVEYMRVHLYLLYNHYKCMHFTIVKHDALRYVCVLFLKHNANLARTTTRKNKRKKSKQTSNWKRNV